MVKFKWTFKINVFAKFNREGLYGPVNHILSLWSRLVTAYKVTNIQEVLRVKCVELSLRGLDVILGFVREPHVGSNEIYSILMSV